MLQINREFLESKTPQGKSQGTLAKPSQGIDWSPDPVAIQGTQLRPASRVRSTPMWQTALLP